MRIVAINTGSLKNEEMNCKKAKKRSPRFEYKFKRTQTSLAYWQVIHRLKVLPSSFPIMTNLLNFSK